LIAVIENNNVTILKDENYPETSGFDLHSYNPTFSFQFKEGSDIPLKSIGKVLIGKIKAYDSRSEALESASFFKNIAFNEDTVLRLNDNGLNYVVVEAQFANGISGIYASIFDNNPFGDKSTYGRILEGDLKENDWKVIESSPVKIESDDSFMLVAQSVMCKATSSYGFQICDN